MYRNAAVLIAFDSLEKSKTLLAVVDYFMAGLNALSLIRNFMVWRQRRIEKQRRRDAASTSGKEEEVAVQEMADQLGETLLHPGGGHQVSGHGQQAEDGPEVHNVNALRSAGSVVRSPTNKHGDGKKKPMREKFEI